jgi:hypothetical protein
MCPLFGKKPREDDKSIIGDAWSLAKGKYNGKDILIRFNTFYKKFKRRDEYKYQVGCAIPLTNPNPDGFPSLEENAKLLEIEELLAFTFEKQEQAIFTVAITTSTMKELVFYTIDPEIIKQRFEEIKTKITSHELQLMIQLDKDWNVYKNLEPK